MRSAVTSTRRPDRVKFPPLPEIASRVAQEVSMKQETMENQRTWQKY